MDTNRKTDMETIRTAMGPDGPVGELDPRVSWDSEKRRLWLTPAELNAHWIVTGDWGGDQIREDGDGDQWRGGGDGDQGRGAGDGLQRRGDGDGNPGESTPLPYDRG